MIQIYFCMFEEKSSDLRREIFRFNNVIYTLEI